LFKNVELKKLIRKKKKQKKKKKKKKGKPIDRVINQPKRKGTSVVVGDVTIEQAIRNQQSVEDVV